MLWPWLMAFFIPFPALAWRAADAYRRLDPIIPEPGSGDALPSLSVIVPARNEAANIQGLLDSLLRQAYPGDLEVFVVDDASTDGTAERARKHPVRVVPAGSLEGGWLGKPRACHTGALLSRSEWLLFTDADTRHAPGSLAAAVRRAEHDALDGLSLLLPGTASTGLGRAAMASAFAGLFAGAGRTPYLLNGQYILIRRRVYTTSGGFDAVRSEPLEDLALGHLVRSAGFRVRLFSGAQMVHPGVYPDFAGLWAGLVRLGAGSLRWLGSGGWLTALFVTGALLPAISLLFILFLGMPWILLPAAWTIVAFALAPWVRRAGGSGEAALAPLGALIVQAAALTGLLRNSIGVGVQWKGRAVSRRGAR